MVNCLRARIEVNERIELIRERDNSRTDFGNLAA